MSEDIIIRRARAEDIHGLVELAVRSFRDTYAIDNDPEIIDDYLRSSLTTKSMREEFDIASNTFLLAFRVGDDDPIGYAKLSTATEEASVKARNSVEIQRLYADKHVIGHGVGAALMRACINTAQDLKCDVIWLGAWTRNERAILFYERWEFETVGRRQFAMAAELQDDLVMARQVTKS
jgi:ribosomal protein S18 acetylase RimI-like enzyme